MIDEVADLTGREPDSWSYFPNADGYDAVLWYSDGRVTFDVLHALDEEYGVATVESHSAGRTGSRLSVSLEAV